MIPRLNLFQNAWSKLAAAQKAAEAGDYETAAYLGGYPVEFALKARICADQNLPGWPETPAEFKSLKIPKTHDLNDLLDLTVMATHVRSTRLNEWGVCQQWRVDSRYQSMGTANPTSVHEQLRCAEAVIRELRSKPGLEAIKVGASDHPFVKLWALEAELAIEKGGFNFFALWHRAGTHNSVDLVVSAPWLDAYSREGASYIAARVSDILVGKEINSLSGLFVLDKSHPMIRQLSGIPIVVGGSVGLSNLRINAVPISRALVITNTNDARTPRSFRGGSATPIESFSIVHKERTDTGEERLYVVGNVDKLGGQFAKLERKFIPVIAVVYDAQSDRTAVILPVGSDASSTSATEIMLDKDGQERFLIEQLIVNLGFFRRS